MMIAESSFRNVVVLWFCNLDDGQKPESTILHTLRTFVRNLQTSKNVLDNEK
jgi:hypothetical protein